MKKLFPIMSNLQTHYHFKLDFQHTGGKWLIHGTKHRKTISCKAWNSPVKYSGRKSKHDIKQSESNKFNPIFKGKVQVWKHPGRCAITESELLSHKSQHVVQKKKNGHKSPK